MKSYGHKLFCTIGESSSLRYFPTSIGSKWLDYGGRTASNYLYGENGGLGMKSVFVTGFKRY